MNNIQNIEFEKENSSLVYLFLSHNKFTSIPEVILSFKNLKHLSLDNNQIVQIDNIINSACNNNVKISLFDNPIKNKHTSTDLFSNDVMNLKIKEATKITNFEIVENQISHTATDFHNVKINNQNENYYKIKNKILKDMLFKDIETELEINIANEISVQLKKLVPQATDENGMRDFYIKEKKKLLMKIMERLIENKQQNEIFRFNDCELKKELNICNDLINNVNLLPETNDNNINNKNKFNETDKIDLEKRELLKNANFLKSLSNKFF